MAKSKKKKSSGAKSAVRKPARKLHARKTGHKTPVRTKKTARRSPKANLQSTESAAAVLLGLNHREKKLDPFIRKQKQKLLQLRASSSSARSPLSVQRSSKHHSQKLIASRCDDHRGVISLSVVLVKELR